MKTERTVCCGQTGQATSRILTLALPPTTVWAIFSCTWIEPHFLQMTVVPRTVFVSVFVLAAAAAFNGGSASATTHAAIVKALLATAHKVAEWPAVHQLPGSYEGLDPSLGEGAAERLDERVARVGRAGDEVD